MAKRSGFAVKITAFIEADPKSMESMNGAMQSISLIGEAFTTHGFRDLKLDSRFMLSREVPDAPVAVTQTTADMPRTIVEPFREAVAMDRMPKIRAAQRRS